MVTLRSNISKSLDPKYSKKRDANAKRKKKDKAKKPSRNAPKH